MVIERWRKLSLMERVRLLRLAVPPAVVLLVILYQLGVAQTLERRYGHLVHYSVEIGFYSLVGPVVMWLTLIWLERGLQEKERLERQVQARTQQLASLTEASADAILSLDHAGTITSWNRGAERMLGYRAAEMIGQSLSRILPDAGRLAAQVRQAGQVQDFETSALTSSQLALTVELTQTDLPAAGADSPVSLIIMRDVTARRERAAILEEERARIARDLHDGVAQTLYFLALKADMARQLLEQSPDQAAAELEQIGQKTRQIIREVRRTIFALRPLAWSHGDFLPALQRFVAEYAEQAGWQAQVEIDRQLRAIPRQLAPTVFRLVQESLNNVAKHAGASRVWVSLQGVEEQRCLRLVVRDNGRGAPPDAGSGQGFGLSQMQARVAALRGHLSLQSEPDHGTTVTAELPLPGDNHA